ncbi:HTH-type transcriptional activator IlvY [Pasteurellaceae bacterium LIM206]|nr:HTH-type transcriptional activator IlvY [Pasteurellaceae bacterium LIM206]
MEFNDLKLFLHLAETLNFSRSAAQNHMSASTLSRQVQRMEDELGQALFLRDNRQVTLTETGRKFLLFAQQHWIQWTQFKQQLNHDNQEISGELHLFCSVTAAYSHLPAILGRFRSRYPKVEIKLNTGDPALAVQQVQSQQADLALAGRPLNLPGNVEFHYIDDVAISLIAPRVACAATQLLQREPINWREIPFIVPTEGPVRERIDQWFRRRNIKHPKIYASVSGHEGIVSMVALGCGVALLPDIVIRNSPLNTQVSSINLAEPIAPFELGVCVQKKSLALPIINAFWQTLRT